MSLINIGKRIGDIDIRLGIPPSKAAFDKADTNKRYGYINSSSNNNSVFNRFRSGLTQSGGLARTTQFIATIDGPQGMGYLGSALGAKYNSEAMPDVHRMYRSQTLVNAIKKNLDLRMDLFCSEASIPDKTVTDDTNEQYYGPNRKFAKNVLFNDLSLTYYTGIHFDERMYFEAWQNAMVDPISHNIGYYNDYAGPCMITITPLVKTFTAALANLDPGEFSSVGEYRDAVRKSLGNSSGYSAYQVQFYEVWPKTIASQALSYGDQGGLVKTTVTFAYRNYATSAWSYLGGHEGTTALRDLASSEGRKEYRNNLSPIQTSLLDNLPFGIGHEIGRVGRQVFDTLKNRLPIGRITGGKVFPKGLPDATDFRNLIL